MSSISSKDRLVFLSLVCVFLALATVCFFFFYEISIPVVIGLCTVTITDRVLGAYRRAHGNLSRTQRRLIALSVSLFWVAIITFFIDYTRHAYNSLLLDFFYNSASLVQKDGAAMDVFLPLVWLDQPYHLHIPLPLEKWHAFMHALQSILFHSIFIVPLMVFYHFFKAKKAHEYLISLVPSDYKSTIQKALQTIGHELSCHFTHKIQSANVYTLWCAAFFYIIGLKGAFVWALAVGILSMIPHLGVLLAIALCMCIAGMQSPIVGNMDYFLSLPITNGIRMILTIIIISSISLLQIFHLKQYFQKGKVHLDAFLEIILLLAALRILGLTGLFFAIPTFIVWKTVIEEFEEELR